MGERRESERFQIAYPLEHGANTGKKELLLVNVSENGLAFISPEIMSEKDELNLYLFLKKKMFHLKAAVVYARQQKKGKSFNIGVKFLGALDEFRKNLTREAEDIKQFCRESNLYRNKNLSIKQASIQYLSNEKEYS